MARIQPEKIIQWRGAPIFKKIWLATPIEIRKQWEKVCEEGTDSTFAVVAAIFRTIDQQAKYSARLILQDPDLPIVNYFFVEWRMPGLRFVWPYGTLYMPVSVSGEAVSGNMVSGMDYENGIFPEELLGKKWQE